MGSTTTLAFPSPPPLPVLGNEILCEILSRCRLKSLTRFKCLCKEWRSLIDQDSYLIRLQLSRSITHPHLLLYTNLRHPELNYGSKSNYFSWADLFEGGGSLSLQTLTTSPDTSYVLKPVNGLTCFTYQVGGVRIFNLNTRKSTPFLASSVKEQLEKEEGVLSVGMPWYGFGYDPESKEHKVVCIWDKVRYKASPQTFDRVCEVLTVGENKWRRIEHIPPSEFRFRENAGPPVYVNGAIYWYVRLKRYLNDGEFLMVFNVGDERFKLVQIPEFLLGRHHFTYKLGFKVLAVDHRPALVRVYRLGGTSTMRLEDGKRIFSQRGKIRIKMFIVDEKQNKNWIEENVSIICDRKEERFHCFQVINNKLVIITKLDDDSVGGDDFFFFNFYYYNWEKESTGRKIDITISSTTVGDRRVRMKYNRDYSYEFTTSVGTLLPVQNLPPSSNEQKPLAKLVNVLAGILIIVVLLFSVLYS